jgi:hypothetical protein
LKDDLREFAAIRCGMALGSDDVYMHDEASGKLEHDVLEANAQVICYFQGARDMLHFLGIDENKIQFLQVAMVANCGSHNQG